MIRPITAKVADVTDENEFPNIAAAIRHARAQRELAEANRAIGKWLRRNDK